jgi:hypothetical protein
MQSPLSPRTVVYKGTTYRVVKFYSSGVGTQFACTYRPQGSDAESTLLLTEEMVEKHPEHLDLFLACARRFDDHLTFAKYLGSSTFWQSQVPPDGLGKPESN